MVTDNQKEMQGANQSISDNLKERERETLKVSAKESAVVGN